LQTTAPLLDLSGIKADLAFVSDPQIPHQVQYGKDDSSRGKNREVGTEIAEHFTVLAVSVLPVFHQN
jgi:hypothetical protein